MGKTITTNLIDVVREDVREYTVIRQTAIEGPEDAPVLVETLRVRARYEVKDDQGNVHHVGTFEVTPTPGLEGRISAILNVDILPLANATEGF